MYPERLFADVFEYLNLAGACVTPGIDLVHRIQPGELAYLSVREQPFAAWGNWVVKLVPGALLAPSPRAGPGQAMPSPGLMWSLETSCFAPDPSPILVLASGTAGPVSSTPLTGCILSYSSRCVA